MALYECFRVSELRIPFLLCKQVSVLWISPCPSLGVCMWVTAADGCSAWKLVHSCWPWSLLSPARPLKLQRHISLACKIKSQDFPSPWPNDREQAWHSSAERQTDNRRPLRWASLIFVVVSLENVKPILSLQALQKQFEGQIWPMGCRLLASTVHALARGLLCCPRHFPELWVTIASFLLKKKSLICSLTISHMFALIMSTPTPHTHSSQTHPNMSPSHFHILSFLVFFFKNNFPMTQHICLVTQYNTMNAAQLSISLEVECDYYLRTRLWTETTTSSQIFFQLWVLEIH